MKRTCALLLALSVGINAFQLQKPAVLSRSSPKTCTYPRLAGAGTVSMLQIDRPKITRKAIWKVAGRYAGKVGTVAAIMAGGLFATACPVFAHAEIPAITVMVEPFFENCVAAISAAGGFLMVFGSVLSLLNCFIFLINRTFGSQFTGLIPFHDEKKDGHCGGVTMTEVRLQLGQIIMYSLELLVAADIIDTLVKPLSTYTIPLLQKIAFVVVIRTVLSYFLAVELKELEEDLEEKVGRNIVM